MRWILFISVLLSATFLRAQRAPESPENSWIQNYLDRNLISLDSVRETSDLLTNYWRETYRGMPLAKRRKAVVRHVKHLTEELEFYAASGEEANEEVYGLLYELEYLRLTYLQKSYSDLDSVVSFQDKLEMLRATYKSRGKMVYRINTEVVNVEPSYFWRPVSEKLYKQFRTLEKAKKIDTDEPMIILYDELGNDGSAPKIKAKDCDLDNEWSLKWGDEVHTDVVCSRLFAALGYDVDHPYFFGKGELILVLDSTSDVTCWNDLRDSIWSIYKVDLTPFFDFESRIGEDDVRVESKLKPYIGQKIVMFKECAIEGRPDRVKRLGSFLPEDLGNASRPELKGALLAHVWIDNWDVREQNTLLTTVHDGNYNYRVSAVFSDLGTSLGVKLSPLSGDFKVGLVNELDWTAAKRKGNKVKLKGKINSWLEPYENAGYEDLKWMAQQIARIDSVTLRKCLNESGWPPAAKELYFHKLASRRASILAAFDIEDPNPISFDRKLNYESEGIVQIKNGKLKTKYEDHPEHLHGRKGRMRNYGN